MQLDMESRWAAIDILNCDCYDRELKSDELIVPIRLPCSSDIESNYARQMRQYLIILLILFSCRERSSTDSAYSKPNYLLKSEKHHNLKFYKEFDMFNRKGVGQLTGDTLYFPFLIVKDSSDSIIEVTRFSNGNETSYRIPMDDRICYRFHDINDGPRHVFTKILKDKIVSYGYDNTLNDLRKIGVDSVYLQDIVPSEIKIIRRDSINIYYFGTCLDFQGIDLSQLRVSTKDVEEYWIKPFTAKLKSGCRDKVLLTEEEGIQKAGGFQYWSQHYGIK